MGKVLSLLQTYYKLRSNANSSVTIVEFTVVQKLNQGTHPPPGRLWRRGSFFVTFLEKQKSKKKKWQSGRKMKQQYFSPFSSDLISNIIRKLLFNLSLSDRVLALSKQSPQNEELASVMAAA